MQQPDEHLAGRRCCLLGTLRVARFPVCIHLNTKPKRPLKRHPLHRTGSYGVSSAVLISFLDTGAGCSSTHASFSQEAEVIQNFSDGSDYRLNFDASISAALMDNLALKGSFGWKRLNKPAAGFGKIDTQVSMALVLNYKRAMEPVLIHY